MIADGLEEENEGLFRKGINTEDGTNPRTVVSYQEQSQEETVMFERRAEPFEYGMSFKATTTPLLKTTKIAKLTDPTNHKTPFITETSNKDDSKENTPLDVAALHLTLAKAGMSTLKDQGEPLSSHRVQLKIKGLAELSEMAETEHFTEATTNHILGHWKYNTRVSIYNVKTNFIPTASTRHTPMKKSMDREQQGCDSKNVIMVQMQISIDFKTIGPIITEEMIITSALRTSGTNSYGMTLKDSGVESFSCIIKVLEFVIIHLSTTTTQ